MGAPCAVRSRRLGGLASCGRRAPAHSSQSTNSSTWRPRSRVCCRTRALGKLRVARLERFDDGHVVDDRAARAILLRDGPRPYRSHVKEEILGDLRQQIAAAQAEQRLVERDVGLGVLVDPGLGRAVLVERGEHLAQGGDLPRGRVFDDEPCRHALQRRPHRDHLEHFLLGLAGDEGATPGNGAHEALVLEPAQGLPDGRAAHSQLDGELAFVQSVLLVVGVDVHRRDGGLELLVDAILEHHRVRDGLQGQVGNGHVGFCSGHRIGIWYAEYQLSPPPAKRRHRPGDTLQDPGNEWTVRCGSRCRFRGLTAYRRGVRRPGPGFTGPGRHAIRRTGRRGSLAAKDRRAGSRRRARPGPADTLDERKKQQNDGDDHDRAGNRAREKDRRRTVGDQQ